MLASELVLTDVLTYLLLTCNQADLFGTKVLPLKFEEASHSVLASVVVDTYTSLDWQCPRDLVVTIKLQDSWYGIHDGYFMVVATANQSAWMRTQSRQVVLQELNYVAGLLKIILSIVSMAWCRDPD